jgi:hypothetical protein
MPADEAQTTILGDHQRQSIADGLAETVRRPMMRSDSIRADPLRQIQRVVTAPLERVAVPSIAETETRRVSESAPVHVKKDLSASGHTTSPSPRTMACAPPCS